MSIGGCLTAKTALEKADHPRLAARCTETRHAARSAWEHRRGQGVGGRRRQRPVELEMFLS